MIIVRLPVASVFGALDKIIPPDNLSQGVVSFQTISDAMNSENLASPMALPQDRYLNFGDILVAVTFNELVDYVHIQGNGT